MWDKQIQQILQVIEIFLYLFYLIKASLKYLERFTNILK